MLLGAIVVLGLMLAFNLQLRELFCAAVRDGPLGRRDDRRIDAPRPGSPAGRSPPAARTARRARAADAGKAAGRGPGRGPLDDGSAAGPEHPRRAGAARQPVADEPDRLDRPAGRRHAGACADPAAQRPGRRPGRDRRRERDPTALESLNAIDWVLPGIDLLEPRPGDGVGAAVDHASNKRRIEEKLLSFSIPAKVVAVNSGPVVTQYEVRPEHHVKVSRIEALADDLAMALAARSIRIEAPIPGKDVVGIEIPNSVSEVVGFKPLVDESGMLGSTSPLTFALGRDVSGKAYAVDLAKMPHLLVAGATGSGKSVCVNALITSLLMRARPDEVRMVLVDLKRVELAPYNGLPHLLQHVIVEPDEAKAVLNWAVREMEERYKLLAAHSVRNIAAFNARPEASGDDEAGASACRTSSSSSTSWPT